MPHDADKQALALRSLSDWWAEMGVDLPPPPQAAPAPAPQRPPDQRPAAPAPPRVAKRAKPKGQDAAALAAAASDLPALSEAIAGWTGCELAASGATAVVYDGVADPDVLVIGEAPGAKEDQIGKPFMGPAGQLLDRMLEAIGLSREANTGITNTVFWRPPRNRNPEPEEIAACRPFLDRVITLARPKLVIAAGGVAAQTLLQSGTGITRLRGKAHSFEVDGLGALPLHAMLHPAYLLRRPQEKSRAWRDLLAVEAALQDLTETETPDD